MISLRAVTSKNLWEIYELKADEKLVGTNPQSLAEAYAYTLAHGHDRLIAYGIYHEETAVGFMMANYDPKYDFMDNEGEPYFYLWRLMIDDNYQNKGYGRAAMNLLIEELKSGVHGNANALYTGVVPESTVTPKFYGSFGFVKTGEMDDDEIVARLAF